jgi:hypothetical protein
MVNLWDFALNKLSSSSLNKLFSHRGTHYHHRYPPYAGIMSEM